MFEGWKDEAAAERELLEIFQDADASLRKRLLGIFILSFKRNYNRVKKDLTPVQNLKYRIGPYFQEVFVSAIGGGGVGNLKKGDPPDKEAEVLGRSLGIFLAAVEYGIAHENFDMSDKHTLGFIMGYVEKTSLHLKDLNKRVSHRFIRNRIKQIAEKHPGLGREKQYFITQIALQFR